MIRTREQVKFDDTPKIKYYDLLSDRQEPEANVEDKIKIQADSSRFRINEYFVDYDRLRSGFVTKKQFERIISLLLISPLSESEWDYLFKKYDTKHDDTFNYRLFLQNVDISIPEKNLKDDPSKHVFQSPEYLGSSRSLNTLQIEEQRNLESLLVDMSSYYMKKNLDIYMNFRDFDKNNLGTLTISQFKRSLTEPNLSESDMNLIIRKYQHPDKPEVVNYLNFYHDLKLCMKNCENDQDMPFMVPNSGINPYYRPNGLISVQEIIDKITVACHKEGIRIHDFFRDYDRLRSGLITNRQFQTGLSYACKKQADLTESQIDQLTQYFRQPDGSCNYKLLCDSVESAFNIPEFEKKPLATIVRPPGGLLSKTLNGTLKPDEEERVYEIINVIGEKVRKFKIQIFPFFKDYDRSTAYTRNVTKTQFGRVLATLNLMPSNKDFEILCKKFEDPVTNDVNYPAFCQVVDEEFTSLKIDTIPDVEDEKIREKHENKKVEEYALDITKVDTNELMARIRNHVLAKRIRVKEFFQDMDPLNHGYVSKSQFIRCISSFGISALGHYHITKLQTEALCNLYKHAQDSNRINWKKFEYDLESVFTLPELEKDPNARVIDGRIFLMPPLGTVKWDKNEELDSSESYQPIIEKFRLVVESRRIDCWPPFKDFDKLNRGHVTVKQFQQCLTKLGLTFNEKELAILRAKYGNDLGYNYLDFLNNLQPIRVEPPKYQHFKRELEQLNSKKLNFQVNPASDMQSLIIKLKDQVFKRRISIYEWLKDHDKLNCGRLPKETFKRAINLTNLELDTDEVELIMDYYKSNVDSNAVEYKSFCQEIELAFSSLELEKNPLLEIKQHAPENPIALNRLTPNDEDIVDDALRKLAERVRKERMQLFPRFEDFDFIKNGYVSQSQFKRVLNDLNLMKILSDYELSVLVKKYLVKIGTRDDVNYIAFADKVYDYGSFEYRKP